MTAHVKGNYQIELKPASRYVTLRQEMELACVLLNNQLRHFTTLNIQTRKVCKVYTLLFSLAMEKSTPCYTHAH